MREGSATLRVWAWPLALGLVSVIGLVAALLADGVADVVSWLALAVPVAAVVYFSWRPRRRRRRV